MARARVKDVRIVGITSTVPDTVRTMADDAQVFGEEEMRRVVKNTGVSKRRIAENITAADLAQESAERLLAQLDWSRESIDIIVMVTQCPDYPAPGNACLLQERLKLGTHCAAFDVNLGCSGYVYGLWMLSTFLSSGSMKRGLLLVGDTASQSLSPHDRSVVPLFGDAGSATALEFSDGAPAMSFILMTDGSGGRNLYSPAGGSRNRFTMPESYEFKVREDGISRTDEHTFMNGAEVLTFALRVVPPLLAEIQSFASWTEPDVDAYVFHQASTFMLKNIGRCSRIPPAKVVMGLEGYGNTSSASIPLAISGQLHARLSAKRERLVLAGFGVGWSWAAAALECGPIVIPEIQTMADVRQERIF